MDENQTNRCPEFSVWQWTRWVLGKFLLALVCGSLYFLSVPPVIFIVMGQSQRNVPASLRIYCAPGDLMAKGVWMTTGSDMPVDLWFWEYRVLRSRFPRW